MGRIVNIYALVEPKTKEVRYIGYTIHSIEKRRDAHVREARRGDRRNAYKNRWINSLNEIPDVILVDVVDEDDADEAERLWILHYRTQGSCLTNLTLGGRGQLGFKQSEATIARRVAAITGHTVSETARAAISAANTGKRRTAESKAKMSARKKGRPWTEVQWAAHRLKYPEKPPIVDPRFCELCGTGPYKGVRGLYRHGEQTHSIKISGGRYL